MVWKSRGNIGAIWTVERSCAMFSVAYTTFGIHFYRPRKKKQCWNVAILFSCLSGLETQINITDCLSLLFTTKMKFALSKCYQQLDRRHYFDQKGTVSLANFPERKWQLSIILLIFLDGPGNSKLRDEDWQRKLTDKNRTAICNCFTSFLIR